MPFVFSEVGLDVLDALSNLVEGGGARRELLEAGAMVALSNILEQRAVHGSERAYKAAGWILVSVAVDPELGERAMASGALPGLVAYARSHEARLREEAAWALANLSSVSANAPTLGVLPVVAVLVELSKADASQPKVTMQAVWALANLAVHAALKQMLAQLGAAEALVETVREQTRRLHRADAAVASAAGGGGGGGSVADEQTTRTEGVGDVSVAGEAEGAGEEDEEGEELLRNTLHQGVRALANLAVDAANRPRIAAGDGLPTLLRAFSAATSNGLVALQEVCARCLVSLSFEPDAAQRLVSLGVVDELMQPRLLRSDVCPRLQHEVLVLGLNLSTRAPQALLQDELIAALMAVFEPDRDPKLQEHAARLLYNLSAVGIPAKLTLFKHGALNRLHGLVAHPDVTDEVRAAAAEVMGALGSVLTPTSRRALVQASLLPNDASLEWRSATHRPRGWSTRGAAPLRSSPLAMCSGSRLATRTDG